jgi:hypothetical protein
MPGDRPSDVEAATGKSATGPIRNESTESDDVEGHSVAGPLAASQIVGQRGNGPRPHSKGDEEPKPLTKHFPSMREDRTGK